MNSFFKILVLATVLLPQILAAQSELDEIISEILTETLSDDGFISQGEPIFIETQGELSDEAETVILRGLDRINGTVEDIIINVGETVVFERLELTLLSCRYPQGDITKDAFAQLVIQDIREDAPRFIGWMFASSPALSALDHPRYDVWVLSCQSS